MTIEYKDSKRIVATSVTTSIQGNNGGSGQHSSGAWAGSGGGGGSSSVGSNSSTSAGGNGGNGTANSITGSSITYATGGAGSGNASDGTGGSSNANNNNVGQSATANRGSGGGAAKNGTQGGAGSSGIVIIRFTTSGNTYSQSGGTVDTSTVSGQTIISYTTTSGTKTFTPTSSFNVQYLVVGGGGSAGAGGEPTGAGGAGGYLSSSSYAVTPKTYNIEVGAGGAQPSTTSGDLGNDGSNSRFDDFIAIGGGAGGGRSNTESIRKGRDGASGGGSGTDVAGSSGATTGGSATTQTITERPTDVQDNSLLVEKNTARRYWFDANPLFTDDFSSDNGTESGSIYSVSGGKLRGTSNRSSGYKYWAEDLGITLSNTAWIVDFDIDFTSISLSSGYGAYNAIQLTDTKGTDGIGLSWIDQTTNSQFYVQKAGSNTPNFTTTISTTGGDGSGKYYVRLIRDGGTFYAKLYSNSTRTTLIEEEQISITSTGLQYFQINNFNNSPGTWNGNVSFEIDNLKVYNGVTTASGGGTWTMQPTFRDDFSTDRWVDMDSSKIGVNTTLERLDFDIKRDGSNDGSALDLGRTLSDTKWRVDYDLSLTTLTESGNSVILHVGLSDEDQTSDSANSQDAYTLRIDVWSAGQVTKLTDSEAQTLEGTALHTFTDLTTTDYYISMIRNSATQCQLIIYSDSARTTVVEDSGIKTTTSGINGLRYFKVTNGGGSSGTGAIIGNIKNLKIYNGVTSIN
jgi:hypothetical protein